MYMTVPVPGMYLSLYCTRYGTRYQTGERQDDIRIPVPVPVFLCISYRPDHTHFCSCWIKTPWGSVDGLTASPLSFVYHIDAIFFYRLSIDRIGSSTRVWLDGRPGDRWLFDTPFSADCLSGWRFDWWRFWSAICNLKSEIRFFLKSAMSQAIQWIDDPIQYNPIDQRSMIDLRPKIRAYSYQLSTEHSSFNICRSLYRYL